MIGVERKGTPTANLVTDSFTAQAKWIASAEGMSALSIVTIPYPVAGIPAQEVQAKAAAALESIINSLTRTGEGEKEAAQKIIVKPEPESFDIGGASSTAALDEVNELFYRQKWNDGFPIVPPTEEALARMLTGTKRPASELIGTVPPRQGRATVRNIALNAVMAGARPEYLPVIITAVEAVLDPAFASAPDKIWGAAGMQSTTGAATPFLVINGPLAKKLGIASGIGCLGRGNRANNTIGRALRLVLTNIGGSQPGVNDMKGQGSAQEFSFCVAENEDHEVFHRGEKSWRPLNIEKGFVPGTSTVSAIVAWTPICVEDGEHCGPEILNVIADSMATLGQVPYRMDWEYFVVLNPTHARCLADAGFSKDTIKEYLFANTRMPWGKYKQQYPGLIRMQPAWMGRIQDDATTVPIYGAPQNVNIIVAGGECPYSQIIRAHMNGVTRQIVDGETAKPQNG